jgi:hypothetical protein
VFVKSQPEKLACCFIWLVVNPVQPESLPEPTQFDLPDVCVFQ